MMGFFDGGGKVLSFGEVGSEFAQRVFGQWRGGVITAIGAARQATDINTRELKFWPNSQDPVMQLPITLDTSRGRCPEPAESADDDLVRDLYITKGKQMYAAARAALRKANAQDFEVGGSLYVRWASGAGKRGDARQFELYYEPPVASSGGFMNDPAPGQPAAAMPPQQPAPGAQHPSEVFAAAGGPPAQSFPAQPPHQPYPDAVTANTPPQPVFNQATGQWEIPQPAAPAAPPTPPQPVYNQQTGQWEIPGQAAPQQPAPPSNGWTPPQQPAPAGPPPQAAAQPVGGPPQGVTNPFRR